MQIQIQQTEQGNPAMYQVIGDNVGSSFFKEVINEDGSSKYCVSVKLNGYITSEIKFLVIIKPNDYIFEKRRDNYLNKWVIDVYRITSIDYIVVPVANCELIDTIGVHELRSYKSKLREKYK